MTNYNEKLDKILNWQQRMFLVEALIQDISDTHKLEITDDIMNKYRDEAKQALTSLIKELVADAKPSYKTDTRGATQNPNNAFYHTKKAQGYNEAIEDYEQNLLKELEEL